MVEMMFVPAEQYQPYKPISIQFEHLCEILPRDGFLLTNLNDNNRNTGPPSTTDANIVQQGNKIQKIQREFPEFPQNNI